MDIATTVETSALVALSALTLRSGLGAAAVVYRTQRERLTRRRQLKQFESFAVGTMRKLRRRKNKAEPAWAGCRKFRVVWREYENEKRDVCSFYLVPADRRPLARFQPGQHLSVEIPAGADGRPATIRQYSISSSPSETRYYRITVKRAPTPGPESPQDSCSNFLHDHAAVGTILNVFAPAGNFLIDPNSDRPIVMIAGGVGLTPLISMLKSLAEANSDRSVWLFHASRNSSEHILRDELDLIEAQSVRVRIVNFYSQPSANCIAGHDYDIAGRISIKLIKALLMAREHDFYVCGPHAMSDKIVRELEDWGVPESSISMEAFGPVALPALHNAEVISIGRSSAANIEPADSVEPDEQIEQFEIVFARSNKSMRWDGEAGTLLEFASRCGVKARCSCRQGVCGTCAVALREGEVTYRTMPANRPAAGTILPCVARPRSNLVVDL